MAVPINTNRGKCTYTDLTAHTPPQPALLATVLRAAITKGLGRGGTEVLFCETGLGLCQKQIDFIVLWANVRLSAR